LPPTGSRIFGETEVGSRIKALSDRTGGLGGLLGFASSRRRRPTRTRAEIARAKFTIIDDVDAGLRYRYESFLAANRIEVAGIEFITDIGGTVYI
jgi:hypothetical protein